ncbi:MAG TPA: hypothetical protein VEI83_09670 [Acidimicrobiales bacterium]|nr:hypothetical protein [Acidimicrobiales bacterium]
MPRVNAVRQTIIDYLTTNGPVTDASGRATALLKEAVGYDRSDAGFSQLVSAMEKDGELMREIRGKKTFKIVAAGGATAAAAAQSDDAAIDYDELAVALLARTAQVLASSQEPAEAVGWARRRIQQLEGRIDELERELARAKAEAKANADERDELRGQLEAASHNLSLLAERSQGQRPGRAAQRLGSDEQALLYELQGYRRRPQPGRVG